MQRPLLFLALCLLTCVGSGAASAAEAPRSYKIGMCPWIAWAPINVAEAKGLWKKRGIDVQVVNQLGEDTSAIEQRRVDLAIDMIGNFIGMQQKGIDMTILAELDWSNGGDKIILRDKAQPTKAGESVGVYHNDPAVLMLLARYLETRKLTLADVKVVEYDPEALNGHFITGSLSAILTYEPYSLQAEKDGGTVVATSATFPGCMPEGLGGRREAIAAIPKDDLKKIIEGWLEAVRWSQDPANWAEYRDIVNARTFAEPTPFDDAAIKDMLANVSIHDLATLRTRNTIGGGLSKHVDDTRNVLNKAGLMKSEFSANTLVDTSLLLEVIQAETRPAAASSP
ncbi:MAG: ABC transporter substrate-binding protein [Planctomycetes bacterium]|nr:ABC transporter substrate-binding protein [Planctomycetota bacterium]